MAKGDMGFFVTTNAQRAGQAVILSGLAALATLATLAGCHPYKSDVARLCDAEQLSATSLKGDRGKLFTWMGRNVASTDGVTLVKELEAKDPHGIAVGLHEAARRAALTSCALAEQAEMLGKDQDYQTDLVNLCAGSAAKADGSIARLDVVDVDDAERMREIGEWSASNAKSPDTPPFIAKLAAAQPKQRGTLLRAEAGRVNVPACPMASTLDSTPPPPPVLAPTVAPNFTVIKVTGPAADQTPIAEVLIEHDPSQAINTCYAAALAATPTLTGDVVTELTFDVMMHRVNKAVDDGSGVKGALPTCVQNAFLAMVFDKTIPERPKHGPLKVSVTLLMTPSAAPGFAATIDATAFGKARPKHK